MSESHGKENTMTGTESIVAERYRQIKVKGWSPSHDDTHSSGELCRAAMAYANVTRLKLLGANDEYTLLQSDFWPWDKESWKPTIDPIRNLVKAGALIAAEIDRLQRTADASERISPAQGEEKKN